MVSVIIVAGGRGTRMGQDINKVYLNLAGQPVLSYTIKAFLNHKNITELIVVHHLNDTDYLKNILKNFDVSIKTITGGHTRTDSVKRGLSMVNTNQKYVLIHDGARPFVDQRLINRVIDELKNTNAVVPTIPVTDTLKVLDGNIIKTTIDRSMLVAAQTPQGFDKNLITKLYHQATQTKVAFTDDVSIAEHFKTPVTSVLGDPNNIKLTTPFDLKLGELLIKEILCE